MQRYLETPRKDWEEKLEKVGFIFHSPGVPYWDESASYSFSMEEIAALEKAAQTVHNLCLEAVQTIINTPELLALFKIPEPFVLLILKSWNGVDGDGDPSIYGRFDFAYDGSAIKMLEYNADTPTSLLEAAIAQYYWQQEKKPGTDQFNSIHEKLIAYWQYVKPYLKQGPLYFTCPRNTIEDQMTVAYMQDTAMQAGLETNFIYIEDIGWNTEDKEFRDLDENKMSNIFKLYPWEWLINESFGNYLLEADRYWMEPAWKMILSNKALLPVLWKLYPGHPNLVPAYFTAQPLQETYVKKPLLSREGANVTIVERGVTLQETEGEYGEEGFIYQHYIDIPKLDGNTPVLGLWMIAGEAAGMGIREDASLISGNLSRFIPHYIKR